MSNTKTVMGQASNQYVAPLNVEDVFSTYLYTGNGSTQTITNGIDLDGEGGLVWFKMRNAGFGHRLVDTERGVTKKLESYNTAAEGTEAQGLTAFNSNGFTVGSHDNYNANTYDFASWTFRKAPKFFTCLTYSGTGPGSGANEQQVSHDLGAKPGIVIIKRTDATGDWWVFTDVIDGSNDYGYLNQTAAFGNSANNVATDSVFNVGGILNTSGATYVAYLFASNDGDGGFGPTGDQDIIKCGSYTGNNGQPHHVELGFEPQWLLVKNADLGTGGAWWSVVDVQRGMTADTNIKVLKANESEAEINENGFTPTATGFTVSNNNDFQNNSTNTYIYIAIRRGTKVPESGTEVFHIQSQSNGDTYSVGFPNDLLLLNKTGGSSANTYVGSRLTGDDKYLVTSSTAAEGTSSGLWSFDLQDSFDQGASTASPWVGYHWKRAPGYFDVVAYSGVGTAGRTVSHNLGVAPEMMWVKGRNYVENWGVYHKDVGATKYLMLNQTSAESTYTGAWNDTAPTSSVFTLGGWNAVNESGYNYIAYLFASLPGISKVGSVSHTSGSATNVDCGFTSGARFILLKVTDSSGSWFVYDTTRGIVAGNDSRLKLDSTAAENTGNDDIDPLSSGFTITSAVSTGSYIFYAIA